MTSIPQRRSTRSKTPKDHTEGDSSALLVILELIPSTIPIKLRLAKAE